MNTVCGVLVVCSVLLRKSSMINYIHHAYKLLLHVEKYCRKSGNALICTCGDVLNIFLGKNGSKERTDYSITEY